MKKRKRTAISLLIMLVVLLLCYFAIKNKQKQPKDEPAETVYAAQVENVVSIKYTNGTTEMAFVKTDDVWHYAADETIVLDQSLMETMVSSIAFIEAEREIKNPDALADYGLKEAAYTVELTDEAGNTTSIYVGNDVDGNYYYLAVGEKEIVYTVDSSVVEAMEFDIEALREAEEEAASEETTEK